MVQKMMPLQGKQCRVSELIPGICFRFPGQCVVRRVDKIYAGVLFYDTLRPSRKPGSSGWRKGDKYGRVGVGSVELVHLVTKKICLKRFGKGSKVFAVIRFLSKIDLPVIRNRNS